MVDEGTPLPHSHLVLPITYAVFSALFGTLSVVFAKCLAILLERSTTYCEKVFEDFFTYICILAWICLVGVWLFRLNEALSKYNPLFIIPLLQVNFIFFAMISGGIYFKEFDDVFFGVDSGDDDDDANLDAATGDDEYTPAPTPGNPLRLPFDIPGPPVAGYVVGCCIMFTGLFLLRPDVSGSATVAPMEEEEPTRPADEESPAAAPDSNSLEASPGNISETLSARSRRATAMAESVLDGAATAAEKVLEIAHAGSLAQHHTPRKDRTPRVDSAEKGKSEDSLGVKMDYDSKVSVDSSPGTKGYSGAPARGSKAESKQSTRTRAGLDSIPASPTSANPDDKPLAPNYMAEAKSTTPARAKSAKSKKYAEPSPAKSRKGSR
jgi:hypothetical protein|mmetsp:Transcript_75496/g.214689  ORF Transcript_75496/g.214689 Transcript_75496/m.214689 type:complete len:380 (+) Transcript_75496:1230-2369(+)